VSIKLLVTLQSQDDSQTVRDSGMEILAEYPDSMLVRGTEEQAQDLSQQGIETVALPEEPVQVAGSSFAFEEAVRAQEAAPVEPSAGRTAYYLVKLAGPPAPEWLKALEGLGVELQGSLGGFTQLVGMLPERVDEVRAQPWVEEVTPYRPAMKVSPKLRAGVRRELDTDALASVAAEDLGDERQLVEVSVFSGESVKDLAGQVREAGGTVVATHPRSLVANLDPAAIAALADQQGIQAIVPFALPELHNDRAKMVMQIPVDHHFADLTLKGTGQIVAIADSGLDSGDPTAMHADIQGRVVDLVSWPTATTWAPFVHEPGSDDGPVDDNSGHGTHVTGSVLGAGTSAVQAGADPVPMGAAPEARVFFQAIEQRVSWKTTDEFGPEGPPFQPWPPAPIGLRGIPADLNALFQQAYLAGARIHTNSWGAPQAGIYTRNSRAVDEFMWNHPDMLIVFSAGNEGVDVNEDGVIDADSIGSPGTAKNCLTVGASENNRPRGSSPPPGLDRLWSDQQKYVQLTAAGHMSDNIDGMAAFSSRGPTDDQRIKPDVVAPGTNILSTLSSAFPANKTPLWGRLLEGHPLRKFYCWSGGTSMATPLVAGAAALVRQHLVSQRGHLQENRKPSGALIKAILVNGAVAPRGQFTGEIPVGPNPVSGFGRVDVTGSVAPEPLHRMLFADEPDHAVSTGQMRTFQVRAADTALPLKFTLVWTDAPGLEGVGGLVNQLYLQLQAPDGGVTDGDVHPMLEVKNNVQQVVVANPVAGAYTIRVRGVSVTQQSPGAAAGASPRQDFALAVSNGLPATTPPDDVAEAAELLGSMAVAH
jgi:subtilisin family serine protease